MKRSDWVEATVKALSKPGAWITLPAGMRLTDLPRGITSAEETAEEMAKWMDTHPGFNPWDPEEEPLPEKLVWRDGITEDSASGWWDVAKAYPFARRKERNAKILKAALEAYNEIGGLRESLQEATEVERLSLDERGVIAAEILLWKQKYASLHERAERTRQRADWFQDVVRRATEYVETKVFSVPSRLDLLAILKEEK